jgi:hypothetical protein
LNYTAELSASWDQCNKDDFKLLAMITCVYAQMFPQVMALEETFITLLARIFLHAYKGTTPQVKKMTNYLHKKSVLAIESNQISLSITMTNRIAGTGTGQTMSLHFPF